jgi:hypothetical protein
MGHMDAMESKRDDNRHRSFPLSQSPPRRESEAQGASADRRLPAPSAYNIDNFAAELDKRLAGLGQDDEGDAPEGSGNTGRADGQAADAAARLNGDALARAA